MSAPKAVKGATPGRILDAAHAAVFAGKMKEWREKHGITQRDIARLADVTERTVSRWEGGAGEPSIAELAVIECEWPGLLALYAPELGKRLKRR